MNNLARGGLRYLGSPGKIRRIGFRGLYTFPIGIEWWCTKGELDGLIANTPNALRRQRLRIIPWVLEGLTADEVATETKLCRRQVQNWVHRFHGEGLAGLEDRGSRGRPFQLVVTAWACELRPSRHVICMLTQPRRLV